MVVLGRPRAGDALGPGLASGDRPRPVRAPADQARRDRRAAPTRSRRSSTRPSPRRSRRTAGPTFVDFPLDLVFMEGEDAGSEPAPARGRRPSPVADGAALERAAALLREAERPVIMAGTNLYWGHGEDALRALAEQRPARARCSSTGWRAAACPPTTSSSSHAHAATGAEGRRRRARGRRADGLPAGLRRVLRRADTQIVVARRRRARAPAPAAGGGRALRRAAGDARRAARGRGRRRCRIASGLDRVAARGRGRAPRGRARRARRRSRAASPDARLRRARGAARPRRDHRRRRRRLRLLRGPRDRLLRARLLARPGPLRLPGRRPGLRARGQARAPRPPGGAAARRRRLRLLRRWSSTPSPATASRSSA